MDDLVKNASDDELRGFLSRVHSQDLVDYLNIASDGAKTSLLGLVSNRTVDFINERGPNLQDGSAKEAERVLRSVLDDNQPCTFCRILEGELPGSFVHRDDEIAVIMDLYPVNEGHMLIIPIEHVPDLPDVPALIASRMMNLAQSLGDAVLSPPFDADGFDLFLANRSAGGQEVFHARLHVLPRYHADGFGFKFPPGYPSEARRDQLDGIAETIKSTNDNFK